MLAPVCMMVGTRAVTFVPYGTVTAMVCVDSVITPVTAGEAKLNAVMALAVLRLGLVELGQPTRDKASTTQNIE
jgi:hypothetical protein